VADSTFRLGSWCLELFSNVDKLLPNPEHQKCYENILNRVLAISINLLNTERPKIGRPIIEFLSFWL
jgi:hypothetical protein